MNPDSAATPAFICMFPLLLVMGVGVVVSVVLAVLRNSSGRRNLIDVSNSVKGILAVGIPLILFSIGAVCTAFLYDRNPPIVAAVPILLGITLAAGATFVLSRWAFPNLWRSVVSQSNLGHIFTQPSAERSERVRKFMHVFAIVIGGMGLLGVTLTVRNGEMRSPIAIFAIIGLAIAGGMLLGVSPKFSLPKERPTMGALFRLLFSKTGAGIFMLGVLSAVIVAVFTENTNAAKVVGTVVIVVMLWRKWWQLRSQTSGIQVQHARQKWWRILGFLILIGIPLAMLVASSNEEGLLSERGIAFGFIVFVVWSALVIVLSLLVRVIRLVVTEPTSTNVRSELASPLLLTADPTAVSRDCPTCGHTIPSDSPHGLCPRCLIRGAMPSPTSTRLRRGVSPIEPPSPADVNEFFPHLEVLELIGAGGMGAVYKARQPTLDRCVALKIVQSPRGDEDPVFAERFAREARAMARLDHPNIVTIHESGEAGGLPFLVMEYVDGVTLREAMANRLLTAPEALAVIPQVCDALEYAHRAGIVHRDIKPENILIDQSGRVKIADFGLAKLADPKNVTLTRTQQAMGTPHYMAPEQWEKPNDVDHRADIYALGVVLYELLTGELPLGRFALPSEQGKGDAKLDAVVVKALAKDAGRRFQNAREMKAALSGVTVHALIPPVVPRKRKGFEYRSKRLFLGLPLVHVVAGWDPVTGKKRVAKGWIAVGDVIAIGGLAIGGVTGFGVIGIGGVVGGGLLALGGAAAVGALAVGGNAAGLLLAVGGNAASIGLSVGGLAAGKFAIGGEAAGQYVISDSTSTPGFGDALLGWVRSFWPFS